MAQFQLRPWEDSEHRAAKLVALATGMTLYKFVVAAVREKIDRDCPRDLLAAIKRLRGNM